MAVWYVNDNDLRVFIAYCEDLIKVNGITPYRFHKAAGMNLTYLYNCKRFLNGKGTFKPKISLNLIIHISQVHKFPFDLSKYLHVLEEQDKPII